MMTDFWYYQGQAWSSLWWHWSRRIRRLFRRPRPTTQQGRMTLARIDKALKEHYGAGSQWAEEDAAGLPGIQWAKMMKEPYPWSDEDRMRWGMPRPTTPAMPEGFNFDQKGHIVKRGDDD